MRLKTRTKFSKIVLFGLRINCWAEEDEARSLSAETATEVALTAKVINTDWSFTRRFWVFVAPVEVLLGAAGVPLRVWADVEDAAVVGRGYRRALLRHQDAQERSLPKGEEVRRRRLRIPFSNQKPMVDGRAQRLQIPHLHEDEQRADLRDDCERRFVPVVELLSRGSHT